MHKWPESWCSPSKFTLENLASCYRNSRRSFRDAHLEHDDLFLGKLRKFDQLVEDDNPDLAKARGDNDRREEALDEDLPPANIETPNVAAAGLPNIVSAKAKKDDVVEKEIKQKKTMMKRKDENKDQKKRDETARSFQNKITKAIIES